jgi:hypothetical protein
VVGLSKSQVSAMAAELDEEATAEPADYAWRPGIWVVAGSRTGSAP